MRGLKKKTIAILFFLVAAMPVTLSVYFFIQQIKVYRSVHRAFEKKMLSTITVNKINAQWINRDKEVLVDGRLFDVVDYTVSGNDLKLTGLFDAREDEVNSEINKTTEQNFPNSTNQYVLISFLFQSYLPTYIHNDSPGLNFSRADYVLSDESLYSVPLNNQSPPPKSCNCFI